MTATPCMTMTMMMLMLMINFWGLVFVNASTSGGFASAVSDDEKTAHHKNDLNKEHLRARLKRILASNSSGSLPPPVPPARECGQVISITSKDELINTIEGLISAFDGTEYAAFSSVAVSTLSALVKYDIQARVICGSCATVMGEVTTTAAQEDFESYCGPQSFYNDTVHSALMLTPVSPTTGEIVHGRIKTYVHMHGQTTFQQGSPSEAWPESLQSLFPDADVALEDIAESVVRGLDFYSGMLAASAGTVAIMPDNIGYAQSYQASRSIWVPSVYKTVAATMWLSAKQTLENTTNCSRIDMYAIVAGYSEGGYASIPAAKAIQGLGVTVIEIRSGGAPFNYMQYIQDLVAISLSRDYNLTELSEFAYAGNSFSTNPDSPYSDFPILAPEWMDSENATKNVIEIMKSGISEEDLAELLPQDPNNVFNQDFVSFLLSAIQENVTNACDAQPTNGTNELLCEILRTSTIFEEVQQIDIPTTLCNSKDDQLVPYNSHVPNITDNPNLSEFMLVDVFPPSGTHEEASVFCIFSSIYSFTAFRSASITIQPDSIEPFEGNSECMAPSVEEDKSETTAPVTPQQGQPSGIPSLPEPPTSSASVKVRRTFVGGVMTVVFLFSITTTHL